MEVVPLTVPRRNDPTVGIPFSKRDVEEWSRLDRLTGMMETAKIETDHWSARSTNAAHKYGKMVDSRERNNKDGTIHESQRKQMEVFQTQVPGGSMQVIRTQTVTTSSKSSKWVSANDKVFSDLQLPINSLDLSSQKTKGSVGRSGSIGGRRPPSRPRSLIGQSSGVGTFGEESSVSTLCHRIREKAKTELFRSFPDVQDAARGVNGFAHDSELDSDGSTAAIADPDGAPGKSQPSNGLFRQKSCSNENVANEAGDEDELKRSAKVRRSLQFTRSHNEGEELDWSGGKTLKERAAEIENLLRRGSAAAVAGAVAREPEKAAESPEKSKLAKRRDSFVSADTLKEVRDRLKKSSLNDSNSKDDGIVTEDSNRSKVKCFVHGMEAMMSAGGKASINGTGSLECRSSCRNSLGNSRSAEWYRRRKSYGFEDVDESDKFGRFNKKSNIESSTDSGFCQSSETVGTPPWSKMSSSKVDSFRASPTSTVITVNSRRDSKNFGSKTEEKSVNLVYLDSSAAWSMKKAEDPKRDTHLKYSADSHNYNSPWHRKSPIALPKADEIRENLKSSLSSAKNPWISQLKGTKLVDRNWAADEQDVGSAREESDNIKSNLLKKDAESNSDNGQRRSKKVEFCKTEVHFAAESGKFNIVETDGKPPPNDIFRRRRRNLAAGAQKNVSGLPETKFGDSIYEKRLLTTSDKAESISEKIEAELKELSKIVIDALPPQSLPRAEDKGSEYKKPHVRLYDLLEEDKEDAGADLLRPRSILKNNCASFPARQNGGGDRHPAGQPPFGGSPGPAATQVWKSTVILRNKRYDHVRRQNAEDAKLYSSDGENELQVRIRNLRKTDPKWWEPETSSASTELKRRSLPDDILRKQVEVTEVRASGDELPALSVAERVKKVEELKMNNYSSKINFRSGEMTVVQNGSENGAADGEKKKIWTPQKSADSMSQPRATISCDNKTTSNPSVMRFSTNKDDNTDSQKYQTTRILINFQSSSQSGSQTPQSTTTITEKPKTNHTTKTPSRQVSSFGSWSPGMRKDLNRYFNDLKSTTLVKETIQPSSEGRADRRDIPKPSKTVHEIIDQFDSLSLPRKSGGKEKRRKTMPINYKAPKEYTQADLEEELKNFTENLDKDFRDLYEEEIGSVRKRAQSKTPGGEKMIRPVIVNKTPERYTSSEDGSRVSSQKASSRNLNYDSDDSDLLADEEVRSYMSAGQGGTESDPEDAYNNSSSRKSFENSILHFRQLELNGRKEIKNEIRQTKASGILADAANKMERPEQKNVASVALKYEDDPAFFGRGHKSLVNQPKASGFATFREQGECWEKTSNSSSNNSGRRERNSYLNVLSLSEKYSRNLEKAPNSSLDSVREHKSGAASNRKAPDERATRKAGFSNQQTGNEKPGNCLGYSSQSAHYSSGFVRKAEDSAGAQEEAKRDRSLMGEYGALLGVDGARQRAKYPDSSKVHSRGKGAATAERKRVSHHLERKKCKERTESVILDELTRAADQILVAVNDYDDDSHLASSEDDDKARRATGKGKMGNLGTISEGKRVTKTELRKSSAVAYARRNAGTQSSASSLESLTRETTRTLREGRPCQRMRQSEASKPLSSRATRLLQRANDRQAAMPQPSSSEDLPSYIELAKKRSLRRQRSNASVKSSDASAETRASTARIKLRSRGIESSSISRTREKKTEKLKETPGTSKSIKTSVRASRTTDLERPKLTGRRLGTEKLEESTKKKRLHHLPAKQDSAASLAEQRKKPLEKWRP